MNVIRKVENGLNKIEKGIEKVSGLVSAIVFVFEKVRDVLSGFMSLLKGIIEPKVQIHVEKNFETLEKANNPEGATKVATLSKEIFELEKEKENTMNNLSDNDINKAKEVKLD